MPLRGESALCGEFAQEVASSTAFKGQRDFSGLLTWGISFNPQLWGKMGSGDILKYC